MADIASISVETFKSHGVVKISGLFDAQTTATAQTAWECYRSFCASRRVVNLRNPGEVEYANHVGDAGTVALRSLVRHPKILDIVAELLGSASVGLYNERVMVKDEFARGSVFLHHDVAYHQGGQNKLSAFIALSNVSAENGGLIFYPRSHIFGHLGDAGEINRELLERYNLKPYTPALQPGDVVFMHSSLWHESPPWKSGEDRVLIDAIYQPASDLTTKELLRGDISQAQLSGYAFNSTLREQPFTRSRVSRIKELEAENERLQKFTRNIGNGML